MKRFQLFYRVNHRDYNFSVATILSPIDSDSYNLSSTSINFYPKSKEVETFDMISSKEVIPNLHELYELYGKISKRLSLEYLRTFTETKDKDFISLQHNYMIISKELNSISKIIKKNLNSYNKPILKSSGLIYDAYPGEMTPPTLTDCLFSCVIFNDWGCFFMDIWACLAFGLLSGWAGFVCGFIIFVVCLQGLTYQECVDYCYANY